MLHKSKFSLELLSCNYYIPIKWEDSRHAHRKDTIDKNPHGNYVLNIHSEILLENIKPSSEFFVFDAPLSQALCLNVLCGIMAPKTVESKLEDFFGDYESTGLWNTSLGQFLQRAPGYVDWPDYSKRVVSEEIVKHFFPERQ